MIVNMLQNLSHKYYSHYIIIKFVGFELIYYVINFNIVSSSMIFSDLVYVFYVLLFGINKLNYFL